jgi:hypothetical protein
MSSRVVLGLFFVVAGGACGGLGGGGIDVVDMSHATPGGPTDGSTPSSTDGSQLPPTVDASSPDSGNITVTSDDGFSAARTACINEINRLRATQSLPPYAIVNTDSINMCVDAQATSDMASGMAHMAWIAAEGSACDGNGQDECEGYGTDAAAIVQCLDDMWNEKNQPNCTGCVGCTAFGGACAGCDFSGQNGPECGHYVNMSATYFASVACGFSATANQGWATQNFYMP